MFIDTSVIVAIFSREPDASDFIKILENTPVKTTSALVILEASMRLSTKLSVDPSVAESDIAAFLENSEISVIPIDASMVKIAVKAFADYGKGRGHPAQLNLADCLSYACAKSGNVPLLYKGADFSRTDLA